MTNPQLEINRVLLAEAADMVAARTKCAIIHHTSDIDAAGDEVEMCVRHILRSRIGNNYCVGHGHICDVTWKTSPQFDIVIADNALFTSLFRTANGTEYFPFETVYAVGEVKSTYRKSNDQIAKFMQACDKLKTLARQDVPPSFIRSHTGGFDLGSALVTDRHGKQNHLFKFMLFVDSGDFDLDDIIPLYKAASVERLPNVVCLLDRGIVVRSSVH